MGVFDDKKFEGLDWISQATEPIDSQANEILEKIPDEINIDFTFYKELVKNNYSDIDLTLERVVSYFVNQHVSAGSMSYQQRGAINDCFEFKVIGENIQLDFEKEAITGGEIKVIKIATTMDEKVLESLLGNKGIDVVSHMYFSGQESISRANEIMELLGKCESGLRTRSERKKRVAIKLRLTELFKSNEWKIKDTELADKVGEWIRDYVVNGNLAAYSNFCRLKVMTHKEQPIYSMEEIE